MGYPPSQSSEAGADRLGILLAEEVLYAVLAAGTGGERAADLAVSSILNRVPKDMEFQPHRQDTHAPPQPPG